MLPLYLDEDSMGRDLVNALRARGVDVITAAAGMIACSDKQEQDNEPEIECNFG